MNGTGSIQCARLQYYMYSVCISSTHVAYPHSLSPKIPFVLQAICDIASIALSKQIEAVIQLYEPFALPTCAVPRPMEQLELESFLQEIDALDFYSMAPKRREPPTSKSRKAGSTPGISRWKRRKEELQGLRAEMQDLQFQVAALTLQRECGATIPASSEQFEESAGCCELFTKESSLRPPNYWKSVAEIERQRCDVAKDENGQLKAKLKRYEKAFQDAKSVVELMKQSEFFSATTVAPVSVQAEEKTGLHERLVSSVVFDLLESRAIARLADLDNIYLEACVRLPEIDVDQVHVRQRGNSDQADVLELKRTRLVPYSADRAFQVMWKVMNLGVVVDKNCNVVKQSADFLISEGAHTHKLINGGVVEMRARCVWKRFVIPEGFIVVIESITEWRAFLSSSDEWSIVTRDSGWGVVHPIVPDGRTTGLCQVQTGMHLFEDDLGRNFSGVSLKAPSFLSRKVSDTIIPSFSEIMRLRHQRLDNELLHSTP
ncbi:hypothetical protein ON010_g937 [Phytophthora cinnamomi]|nr:hypothetical protein ON010_g937 [Phytophthora cinnamomi]